MQPSARCFNLSVGWNFAIFSRLWKLFSVTRTPGVNFWKGPGGFAPAKGGGCMEIKLVMYVYILRRVSVNIVAVKKQYYVL